MSMRLVWVMVFAALGAGCSSSRRAAKHLQRQAAFDLNCPAKQVQVSVVGGRGSGQYAVQGCGRRANYVDGANGPQLAGPVEGSAPAFVPPSGYQPPQPQPQYVPPPPPGDSLTPPPPPPQP